MEDKNNRRESRFNIRFPIQYEVKHNDGTMGVITNTFGRDLGLLGASFYSNEKMELGICLRVTLAVSDKDKISFEGRVVRIEICEEEEKGYIIGVQIDKIGETEKTKIDYFLRKINIHSVLDNIDMENIMDIHLAVGYPPITNRLEDWIVEKGDPFDEHTLRALLFNMLDEERYKKFIAKKELNFVFAHKSDTRFRVNLHVQQGMVEGVFRLLPSKVMLPSQLGLPPVVEQLLENKGGLILVAGRTGSGKTTTISSMVEFLNNSRKGVIISIEDPIEYIHTNKLCIIKQREVGRDTLSFSNAAKNALRQNPAVLVIGEILDMETMETAITAAETGILVLSSIHATNSAQVLDRVLSLFGPELYSHILSRLALVLKGVITQVLVPRLDRKGFVVAVEILLATDAVRKIIRNGEWKQIPMVIETGKNIGMQTINDSLDRACRLGLIDVVYTQYIQHKF